MNAGGPFGKSLPEGPLFAAQKHRKNESAQHLPLLVMRLQPMKFDAASGSSASSSGTCS